MPQPPHICEQEARLRNVYRAALHELVTATEVFRLAPYGRAFQDALDKTRQARTRYETAHGAWQEHRKTHGCSSLPRDDSPGGPGDSGPPRRSPRDPGPLRSAAGAAVTEPDETDAIEEIRAVPV